MKRMEERRGWKKKKLWKGEDRMREEGEGGIWQEQRVGDGKGWKNKEMMKEYG